MSARVSKLCRGIVAEFGQLALLPTRCIASALRQQNSPDAHILASSSDDQTMKLWDWARNRTLQGHMDVRLPLALKVVPLLVAVLIEQ